MPRTVEAEASTSGPADSGSFQRKITIILVCFNAQPRRFSLKEDQETGLLATALNKDELIWR